MASQIVQEKKIINWLHEIVDFIILVQEIVQRMKNVRLRFSFWAHMLLSWVSVMQMNLAYGPLDVGYTK